MAKRKRRVVAVKKKKTDAPDEALEEEETEPSAKKVAASSTSFSEDDASQVLSLNSIGTSDISGSALGFSSHFWCNYCEFSADTKQELVIHMRQHMIKCSFCPFSSLSRAEVLRHVKCEHADEVEVDSSSSTDHDMDKDPCCACIFCDFMTYSTEYLEKHTTAKHRGMLPKSVAKMISKSVSAKVRQADALFYSPLSTDLNHREVEQDPPKSESPTSSNTIVIEEENKNLHDIKPFVKDLLSKASLENVPSSQVSSCAKLDPSEEEQAEKLANQLSQALTKMESPSDWKVKVETSYCISCPYSNVAIDKLKCHTFSQHPQGAAIARNSSGGSPHDLSDVTFFCVKESCPQYTNTSLIYEEHIMTCCPLHQALTDDERERLKTTLEFLTDFHKKHGLKMATGFQDFVSFFNKIFPSQGLSGPSSSSHSNLTKQELHADKSDTKIPIANVQDFNKENSSLLSGPTPESEHLPLPVITAMPCPPVDCIEQHAPFGPPSGNHNAQPSGIAMQDRAEFQKPIHPALSHQTQNGNLSNVGVPHANFHASQKSVNSQFINGDGSQNNCVPPSQVFVPPGHGHLDKGCNDVPFSKSQRLPPGPQSNSGLYNAGQVYAGQGVEPDRFGTPFQNNAGTLPTSSSTFVPPQPTPVGIKSSVASLSTGGSSNQIGPHESGSLDMPVPVNSSNEVPCTLPPQQFQSADSSQMSNASLIADASNPPKMLDLLSDSYNILLDDDLDLSLPFGNQLGEDIPQPSSQPPPQACTAQQPAVSNVQQPGEVNPHMPMSSCPPEFSMQQSSESVMSQPPTVSFPPAMQSQQPTLSSGAMPSQGAMPPQYPGPGLVSQQPPVPSNSSATLPAPTAVSVCNSMGANPTSQDPMSHPTPSFSTASMQQYANPQQSSILHVEGPGLAQSSAHCFPQPAVSQPPGVSGPINVSSPQPYGMSFPSQQTPSPLPSGQAQAFPNAPGAHGYAQADNQVSQNPNLITGGNNHSGVSSFLETPSGGAAQPVESWQRNQPSDVPNFLVTSPQSEGSLVQNPPDPDCFPHQDTLAGASVPASQVTPLSSYVTPVKSHSMQGPRNFPGNSPLSPSIYLNGQAPRHNRSNWTSADMMPRGVAMPQMRPRMPAPGGHPDHTNVRQNLFPPPNYRGRGRPRGQRMPSRFGNPGPRPHDDDVIVTAVVRGPSPSQVRGRPVNRRGMVRGQRRGQPMPRGPGRGMVRGPLNAPPMSAQAKKPFDVSKHFVDLACEVNSSNDDENNGEDEIQIMGVTHANGNGKGQSKVDIKKFSFCCVHCGKDQGSKSVMKQHMSANHSDSLLGAFRNTETGQLLFFCPRLRCEFMTYDEKRLTDHLYSCYNLDKSKHFPFDLPSALKNLRSLKIRTVNTNAGAGGSQGNPIDIDGQGLRDTFHNNLTDAFDDMVENTIGRQMIRPNNSQPPPSSPSNQPQGRPPAHVRPQRGRPLGSQARMSTPPHYYPRQPHMPPNFPGQHGSPRMPPNHQPYRMPGRRNFRHAGPAGAMGPVRGHASQMPRHPLRAPPPNPRPFLPVPTRGNVDEPILIDIDSETPSTPPAPHYLQNCLPSANDQPGASAMSTDSGGITAIECTPVSSHQTAAFTPSLSQGPSSSFSSQSQVLGTDATKEVVSVANSERPEAGDPTNSHPITTPLIEVEVAPQNFNSTALQQNQNYEMNTPAVTDTSSQDKTVDNQDLASGPDGNRMAGEEEFSSHASNEEQVNAILLKKVFAKVTHMPKKLSQRLVLRFKEFAAKRGVIITPNSKVIDEFVERISYKGSNPLSKQQHPQQQQQQHPMPHQPQQLQPHQPQHEQQRQQEHQHHQQMQYQHRSPPEQQQDPGQDQLHANPLSMEQVLPNQSNNDSHLNDQQVVAVPARIHSTNNEDLSVSQAYNVPHHRPNFPQRHDPPPMSHRHDITPQHQNLPNVPRHQNQSESPNFENEASTCKSAVDSGDSETQGKGKGDSDIIETKIILAEKDFKFSGSLANIAKSVIDQGRKAVKSEYNTSSPSSGSASPLNVPYTMTCKTTGDSLGSSRNSSPSSQPMGGNHTAMSLREQVMINEKLLKKEVIPMSFPSTREGESILVQSSIDHLVSGNDSLEVDIAGKPLCNDSLFPESEGTDTDLGHGSEKLILASNEVTKDKPETQKCQTPMINKSSGKLILKVKKGHIQRKVTDSSTNVVTHGDSKSEEAESAEEHFVRRSERKRKIRQSQASTDDAMNELDELLSDDDAEYHVESDESYDESDYEGGHSNKKKPKVPEDPNAFKVNAKGSFVCWVCYKKFARCLGVKRHILKKHPKALCALTQTDSEDGKSQSALQVLLFCPKICKYATLDPEAFSEHLASCQKSEMAQGDSDLVETQMYFITQEYVELQEQIASGFIFDLMKQKSSSRSGKRRRQSSSNVSSCETQIEVDSFTLNAPPSHTSDVFSHHQQGPL